MKKAFTLIELMIVLAILATVIGVCVLRVDFLKTREAREELTSVLSMIREAKETAILKGETVELAFDINASKVTLSFFGRDEAPFRTLEARKLQFMKNSGRERILFSPEGFADSGVTMRIQGLPSEKILTIRPITGKAKVKDA